MLTQRQRALLAKISVKDLTRYLSERTATPRPIRLTRHASTAPGLVGIDLGSGRYLRIQGRAKDPRGRPVDVSIQLYDPSGAPYGYVVSLAGRFSLFDLRPGTYRARVVSRRSGHVSRDSVTVPRSGIGTWIVRTND